MTQIDLVELFRKIDEKDSWGKNELKELISKMVKKDIKPIKKETL